MTSRLLLAALLLILPATAVAQSVDLMALNDVRRGQLLFRTVDAGHYAPAPLVATEVEIVVGGIVARTVVKQHFVNPTRDWLEGRYVFPLPEGAAVNRMTLSVGDRVIEAKIAKRQAARKAYNAAKAQGRRTALVEQHRPNMFSNEVANIPPGGRIAVELHYLQQLRFDQGKFSLRFPLVVAPRFDAAAPSRMLVSHGAASDGQAGEPPVVIPVRDTETLPPLNPVSLTVRLDAGMALDAVASNSHKLTVDRIGTGQRRIALADKAVPADRDFVLDWTPKLGAEPFTAFFRETVGDHVHVLAIIMPPADARAPAKRASRDIVFILDRSGSMGGESIRAARSALDTAIDRLADGDKFNLIRFSDVTDSLWESERAADRANRLFAKLYLRSTEATGGTVMQPALHRALPRGETAEENARLRQVVFVTDGAVSNETQLFRDIRSRLGASRLFTIGIGSAPNSYFMRKAAEAGRGSYVYIGDVKQVQAKMAGMFEKLERPALTGLSHAWQEGGGNAVSAESFPSAIPDLYVGEPVVLVSRLPAAALSGDTALAVKAGDWRQRLAISDAIPVSGIATIWARAKIMALMDSGREGVPEDAVKEAVTRVGLTHSLVTRYTSLLATEKTVVRPGDKPVRSGDVPLNLPRDWKFSKVFGEKLKKPASLSAPSGSALTKTAAGQAVMLPQGATSFFVHLATGIGLLAMALLVFLAIEPRRATA
ncbi:MAG: marine proteobacterial sortase target protein [Alphaproteobacteria bacterium]